MATSGTMGEFRITKSNGVCYRGKPQHPVHLYPEDFLSTEIIKGRYYYVVKVPLKGGYWRPRTNEVER